MIEARARHRGDANVLRHPFRELDVVQITELREIGEDVVRALRNRELEAGLGQRFHEHGTTRPVIHREMIEVLRVEVHADRARRLQRRGRPDGQEVVDLADGRRLLRGRDRIAQSPAGAAERLRETGDRDRASPHAGQRRQDVMLTRIANVLVDLVGDRPGVVLPTQLRDQLHGIALACCAHDSSPLPHLLYVRLCSFDVA